MFILRLIRLPNIIIILLTQALIFYGLIMPALNQQNIPSEMGTFGFIMMFVITALITISGYLINDLVDMRIDSLNKKDKMILMRHISIASVKRVYFTLVILGFILSLAYAYDHDVLYLLFIYPLSCALLAFYSSHLKGMGFTGNIVVSLFSAGVAAIVLLFERESLKTLQLTASEAFDTVFQVIFAFIIFAFASSLYREIIKDMEDIEGDRAAGVRTGAVIFGITVTKKIALIVGAAFFFSLIAWLLLPINLDQPVFLLSGIILSLIILYSIFSLIRSKTKRDFHVLSQIIKVIMFLGLIYLLFYIFLLTK